MLKKIGLKKIVFSKFQLLNAESESKPEWKPIHEDITGGDEGKKTYGIWLHTLMRESRNKKHLIRNLSQM